MSTRSLADVFDLIEDMVDELELEEILARPPEEVRAELIADGADLAYLDALVEHLINGGPHPGPRRRNGKDVSS